MRDFSLCRDGRNSTGPIGQSLTEAFGLNDVAPEGAVKAIVCAPSRCHAESVYWRMEVWELSRFKWSMQVAQAWALISISEGRQYAGNLGYHDDPKQIYRYDSLVPNHLQLSIGDLVFVRDREFVLGMSRIEQIIVAQGTKTRLKCPTCGTHRILERQQRLPRWRCVKGHLFDKPTQEEVKVSTYEARYGRSFVSVGNVLSVADLKRAAPRPSDQLSIERIDLTILADRLVSAIPSARDFFARYLQATRPVPVNSEYVWRSGVAEVDEFYKPSFVDTRERIKRAIALRRGQRTFRDKLIRRYGAVCMISGCPLLDIVEAAHIWPYRNQADNHPGNGLLLRADLHTLFDLDLIGIRPNNMRVSVHPAATAAGYAQFDDAPLRLLGKLRPSVEALALRWACFLEEQEATAIPHSTSKKWDAQSRGAADTPVISALFQS